MQLGKLPEVSEFTQQAIRGAPAVVGATYASLTLNEWVMIATGIYVIVQVAYLARKWWREESDWYRGKRGRKVRADKLVKSDGDE